MKRPLFLLKLLILSALLATAAVTTSSCDSTARITVVRIAFDRAQVVSATPVKLVTAANNQSAWVPACDGSATHTRLNFNLRSLAREGDEDRQIRPGDLINTRTVELGRTLSASNFDLSISCVDDHSGTDDNSAVPCPAGSQNPPTSVVTNASADALQFVDNFQGERRGTPLGLALLIDISGSTDGVVDGHTPAGASDPACIEGADGFLTLPTGGLDACATDSDGFRFSAASRIITQLNPDDRHILFGFNEQAGVTVACNIPGYHEPWRGAAGAVLSEQDKQTNCYTNDKRYTLGEPGAGQANWPTAMREGLSLKGKGVGRTNLWTAVQTTYDYMRQKQEVNRHVVVISDGPDSCRPGSSDFQHCLKGQKQLPCADSRTYGDALSAIEQYQQSIAATGADPVGRGVHVSFIHIQAKGEKEADPRMQEIACMTGGHYIFINATKLNYATSDQRNPIEFAAEELRMTFGGHYGLVTAISKLAELPKDGGAQLGRTHAIAGNLRFDNTIFTANPKDEGFNWGPGYAGEQLPSGYDGRLLVHRPCTTDADCGGTGAECTVTCDQESRACVEPPPGASCGGGNGVCCGTGNCAMGQTICNDPNVPLSCP